MSWANLDDRLHAHPKVRKLQRIPVTGMEAFGVWCWCLSWCRAYSPTTGKISIDVVADAWYVDAIHVRELFVILVDVKLLDAEVSVEDEYLIHDWLDWQIGSSDEWHKSGGRARAATARRVGGRFAPSVDTSSAGVLVISGTSMATPLHASPLRTPRAHAGGAGETGSSDPSTDADLSEFRRRVQEPGR